MKCLITLLSLSILALSCNGNSLDGAISKDSLTQSAEPEGIDEGQDFVPPETPQPQPNLNPPLVTEIATPIAIQPAVIGGAYLTCIPNELGAQCDIRDKFNDALVDPDGLEMYVIAPDLIWKSADYQRIELGKYRVETKLPAFAVGLRDSTRAISATWVIRPAVNLVKNGSFEGYSNGMSALFETTAASDWVALPGPGIVCPKNYIDIQVASADIPAAQGNRFMDLNAVCDTGAKQLYSNHKISQTLPTVKGNLYQTFFSISGNPKATSKHAFNVEWNKRGRSSATFEAISVLHWIELKFLQVAESNADTITLHDDVINTEGFGGLIDNVQVYGLGSGPAD